MFSVPEYWCKWYFVTGQHGSGSRVFLLVGVVFTPVKCQNGKDTEPFVVPVSLGELHATPSLC